MPLTNHDLLKKAYSAFNSRDIEVVLSFLHPEVHWPNGWEGGYINGIDAVRSYWTRQWSELDPTVVPIEFITREDGKIEVIVRQLVKDLNGSIVFNGILKHTYTFDGGLIKRMEIEQT